MASGRKYYLGSISERWVRELAAAPEEASLFFPYITTRAVEQVLGGKRPPRCKVYTLFHAKVFMSGASSLDAIRRLLAFGIAVYDLPNLHAKMLIVPGQFASIGSQNLTTSGHRRNHEATVAVSWPLHVQRIERHAANWTQYAIAVTTERIDEMEAAILPLQERYEQLTREAANLDARLRRNELRRNLNDEQRESLRHLERAERHSSPLRTPSPVFTDSTISPSFDGEDFGDPDEEPLSPEDLALAREEPDLEEDDGSAAMAPTIVPQLAVDEIVPGDRLPALRATLAALSLNRNKVLAEVRTLNDQGRRLSRLFVKKGTSLEGWRMAEGTVTLPHVYRSVCMLDDETCRWGFARVAKSRIAFVAEGVRFKEPFDIAGSQVSVTVLAEWHPNRCLSHNLRLILRPASDPDVGVPLVTLNCWFDLHSLELLEVEDSLTGSSDLDEKAFSMLKPRLLPMVLSPFKYDYKRLHGVEACAFFGDQGTRFEVRLAAVQEHHVLVARRINPVM